MSFYKKILPTLLLIFFFINILLFNFSQSNASSSQKLKSVFKQLPHSIPEEYKDSILKDSQSFLQDIQNILQQTPADVLLMADKQNNITTYVPPDLIVLDNYSNILTLNKTNMKLRKVALQDLLDMVQDAKKQNIILPISSTYRSFSYQKTVFERTVKRIGLQAAQRESARAGTSQHQLGLAIDFGNIDDSFENTKAGKWLFTNAWKYGYSLSYPRGQEAITGYRYESWHYRYIGKLAATFEHKYFGRGQQYVLEIINLLTTN